MSKNKTNQIAIFEGSLIRRGVLNGEWVYSVVDIIKVLTDSREPRRYWSDLKIQLEKEGSQLYEKIVQLKLKAADGKMRNTDVLNRQLVFRLIQSIPSPKAEPFKLWLANLGEERLQEIEQPGKAIQRGKDYYLAKGYDKKWVESRTLGIETRNQLTDVIKDKGINTGQEYAILTNEVYNSTFGFTAKEYKEHKGLDKNDSLRDNMTLMEIVSTAFTEASATSMLLKSEDDNFHEVKSKVKKAGTITQEAIKKIEQETGESVATSKNYKHLDTNKKRKEIISNEVKDKQLAIPESFDKKDSKNKK